MTATMKYKQAIGPSTSVAGLIGSTHAPVMRMKTVWSAAAK